MNEDLQQFAIDIYSPLFAEHAVVGNAYKYAMDIAKSSDNPAAVTTAIHVLMNSIAKEIERLNK